MTGKRQVLIEVAPSQMRADQPIFGRWIGMIGWCLVLLGVIVVSFNLYVRPSVLTEEWGWFLVIIGVILALVHAAIETDGMIRRYTAVAGIVGIVGGVIWSAAFASQSKPWGVGLIPFFPGMFFVALFARKEEDEFWRSLAQYVLGGIGVIGALIGVILVGLAKPWSENVGYVLLLLSATALPMYFGLSKNNDKITYYAALGLVAFGAGLLVVTIVRAIIPDLMYEWRAPVPKYAMRMALVGAAILLLGLVAWLVLPKGLSHRSPANIEQMKSLGRIGVMSGAMLTLIGVVRLFATDILRDVTWFTTKPPQFLIPNGVVFIAVSLGLIGLGLMQSSENRLIVMIRREFIAFFVSPIAYLVLVGYTCMGAVSYYFFLGNVIRMAEMNRSLEEPFLEQFFIGFMPVLAVIVAVPLLTMRLLSEEKRTGTLEVLLTAPLSEWHVVLSKFVAGWLFFILLWVPWFMFLVALRLETGKPFDFYPLVGFMIALAASGSGFVAMGLFFSSLTKNQIIAAVLTLLVLIMMVFFYFLSVTLQSQTGFLSQLREVFRVSSFIDMWLETWAGKLWLRDIVFQLSATIFWLFLSVKVLEARRWT